MTNTLWNILNPFGLLEIFSTEKVSKISGLVLKSLMSTQTPSFRPMREFKIFLYLEMAALVPNVSILWNGKNKDYNSNIYFN